MPIEPGVFMPDAVGFDVTAIELGGGAGDLTPGDYTITDEGDHYELKLGPKSPTTNLPLHSRLDLALIYFKNGQPFRFEDQTPPALHLYHTSKLTAFCHKGKVSIGPGKGATMQTTGEQVANWSPRWEQTGGMNPTLKITVGANEQRLVVTVEVPAAGVADKPLWLPVAS